MLSVGCKPKNAMSEAISRMVDEHPKLQMQDVYKSFYQDRFGSEHMIGDTAAVREYLLQELEVAATDTVTNPYCEPVGAQGRHVRIYLRCVNEGLLSAEQLSDAFIRSAKPSTQPEQSWVDEWEQIEETARQCGICCSEEDSRQLRRAADMNRAVRHSDAYRDAYHPHYRIVEKGIVEREFQALRRKD